MTACVHCGEPAVPGHESPHGLEHCSAVCLEAAGLAAGMAPPNEAAGWKYWLGAGGHRHRDYDLPAVVCPGVFMTWCRHGVRHRDGGRPAVVYGNGRVTYWLDGVRYEDGTYTVRYD